MHLKAVIFDFGNVLSLPNRHVQVLDCVRRLEIPEEEFLKIYRTERHLFDQGDLDVWEYWTRVMDRTFTEYSRLTLERLIDLDMQDWTRLNKPVLEWHHALAESGYLTGILSNLPYVFAEYFWEHFPWLEKFDAITFSCDVGAVKPEPEIYRVCLKSLGVEPEQALFIDDMQENVEGASRVGMHAELFVSAEETIPTIVEQFGLSSG